MKAALALLLVALAPPAAGQVLPFASYDGASQPVLNDPHDLDFGPDGRLYVADKFGSRIVAMDPDTLQVLGTWWDGQLAQVHDISIRPDGGALIAVTGYSAVAIADLSGPEPVIESVLRGFPRTEGALWHSNGRFYVMASGLGQLMAVEGEQLVASAGGFAGAHDVEEGPDGSVWVADTGNRRLVRLSEDLEVMQVLDAPAYGFAGPRYLAFDELGRVVVADQDAHRIVMIDPADGRLVGVLGDGAPGLGPGKFDDPEGIAVRGNAFYISDSDNNRIVRYVVVMN